MAKYDINVVIMGGRLTRDPELRYTPNGKAVCEFPIANNRGEYNGQENTNFISVITWGKLAENCANHLRKGREVLVEGSWNQRFYDNNEGRRVYVHELIASNVKFVGFGSDNNGNNNGSGQSSQNYQGQESQDPFGGSGNPPIDISEDDLPF